MRREGKQKANYIAYILIILVMFFTVIRICGNTTQNKAIGISGVADGGVMMEDARYLELELDAPMAGLTGFCFRFEGNRDEFENTGFLVTASILNDPLNPQMLYENTIPLTGQAYDYQNENYIVIIPFTGEVQQGDHLRIAIMGMGMLEKDGITVITSSQIGITGAVFEINDFTQDSILAGSFYYQTKEVKIFPILIQGIVISLLILLLEEILRKTKRKRRRKPVVNYHISTKKRILNLLPVVILLIVALDYTYYAGIKTQIQQLAPEEKTEIYPGKEASYKELNDGEAIFCQSRISENWFGGFGLHLKEPYNDNGILTIEVSDLESQDLVASAEKAIYELTKDKGNFLKFDFDSPVKKSANKEYLVSIYYSGTEPIEFLADNNGGNNPKLIPLYQKNNYLNLLFFIFSILITGFTLMVFLCGQNKWKVEKLLFITVVFLGILFEIVITPFAVPDEASHIDTAYRMSNQMLGIKDTGIKDAIYKRVCDIYTDSGVKRTINADNYKWLYDDWFKTEGNRKVKLIFAADNTVSTNALYFFPAAVSITVGRILGMGFLPTIFLARTANLLLAAWMIYQSVKKLPFGKSILCVIAMLPLTIQEIASCSYDALIIAVSIMYVSYCVAAIYSKTKLEKADILVIIITAIMLGICKGGVYAPLYLLLIWLLIKRGYIKVPQKKTLRIASVIIGGSVVLAGIIGLVYILRQPVDTHSLRYGYYSLSYLLQHPGETIRIFENTLYESIYQYMVQYIGSGLGSFQISVRFIVPLGYMLLIGSAVICDEKHLYLVNNANRYVFLSAAILSMIAVHMAFLISYTTYGNKAIGGVQGRYFIPVLWLLLICLRKGRIVNKKKQYRKIVLAGYLMGICTVLQVVINVLAD